MAPTRMTHAVALDRLRDTQGYLLMLNGEAGNTLSLDYARSPGSSWDRGLSLDIPGHFLDAANGEAVEWETMRDRQHRAPKSSCDGERPVPGFAPSGTATRMPHTNVTLLLLHQTAMIADWWAQLESNKIIGMTARFTFSFPRPVSIAEGDPAAEGFVADVLEPFARLVFEAYLRRIGPKAPVEGGAVDGAPGLLTWELAPDVDTLRYQAKRVVDDYQRLAEGCGHLQQTAGKHGYWLAQIALQTELLNQLVDAILRGDDAPLVPLVSAASYTTAMRFFTQRYMRGHAVLQQDIGNAIWKISALRVRPAPGSASQLDDVCEILRVVPFAIIRFVDVARCLKRWEHLTNPRSRKYAAHRMRMEHLMRAMAEHGFGRMERDANGEVSFHRRHWSRMPARVRETLRDKCLPVTLFGAEWSTVSSLLPGNCCPHAPQALRRERNVEASHGASSPRLLAVAAPPVLGQARALGIAGTTELLAVAAAHPAQAAPAPAGQPPAPALAALSHVAAARPPADANARGTARVVAAPLGLAAGYDDRPRQQSPDETPLAAEGGVGRPTTDTPRHDHGDEGPVGTPPPTLAREGLHNALPLARMPPGLVATGRHTCKATIRLQENPMAQMEKTFLDIVRFCGGLAQRARGAARATPFEPRRPAANARIASAGRPTKELAIEIYCACSTPRHGKWRGRMSYRGAEDAAYLTIASPVCSPLAPATESAITPDRGATMPPAHAQGDMAAAVPARLTATSACNHRPREPTAPGRAVALNKTAARGAMAARGFLPLIGNYPLPEPLGLGDGIAARAAFRQYLRRFQSTGRICSRSTQAKLHLWTKCECTTGCRCAYTAAISPAAPGAPATMKVGTSHAEAIGPMPDLSSVGPDTFAEAAPFTKQRLLDEFVRVLPATSRCRSATASRAEEVSTERGRKTEHILRLGAGDDFLALGDHVDFNGTRVAVTAATVLPRRSRRTTGAARRQQGNSQRRSPSRGRARSARAPAPIECNGSGLPAT